MVATAKRLLKQTLIIVKVVERDIEIHDVVSDPDDGGGPLLTSVKLLIVAIL